MPFIIMSRAYTNCKQMCSELTMRLQIDHEQPEIEKQMTDTIPIQMMVIYGEISTGKICDHSYIQN
ncbi:hypothetical protein BLA29_000394 [Euroglyphus maynei]|uniref:Uncharacterized protein n=1 Tax=Euroglyphus maynei TaxID=6958 RepID=A0A1Y3B430_EURMA|nr:hypothetical protein BLA29_000394 [Euroglyphus maynei]